MLLATLNGIAFAFASDAALWPPTMMGAAGVVGADDTVVVEGRKVPPATAIEAREGMGGIEVGRLS